MKKVSSVPFASVCFACAFTLSALVPAGTVAADEAAKWTAEEDHQRMLERLGIRELRRGADGRVQAGEPHAANYDEKRANPFEAIPEALRLDDGRPVRTPSVWWVERRPEIVDSFEREVYGKIPDSVPGVAWEVTQTRMDGTVDGVPVIGKRLVGRVDNAAYPGISVDIELSLVLPQTAAGPVPVLLMFTPWSWELPEAAGLVIPETPWPRPETDVPPSPVTLIRAGWGYAFVNTQSIQPDNGASLAEGIIGLTNRGQPRSPEQWGALRAWAWGASRALDHLETEPRVDPLRVGIEGVSRYGKAALVALAFEPRFAMGLIGSSGKGGATLHRRNFGERVENLAGGGAYHWMAGNYLKYAAEEGEFGRRDARDLPVDSHQLIALCAPRLTFISYGIPEQGDAHWLDQRGSYMATVAAGEVFELLGARGIGVEEDFREAEMPPVEQGLLDGELAWRQHAGGHESRSNMQSFVDWAERLWASE